MPEARYLVGPPGSEAAFNSIQAAIDQAVVDGHDTADTAVVEVLAGVFTEDIALAAGIAVVGLAGPATTLVGTITIDLTDGGGIENTGTAFSNITVEPAPGAPAVRFTGGVAQTCLFLNCEIRTDGAEVLIADNTGVDGAESSAVLFDDCRVEAAAVVGSMVNQSAGLVAFFTAEMSAPAGEKAVEVSGGALFVGVNARITGQFDLVDGTAFLLRPQVETTGQAALNVSAGAGSLCFIPQAILATDTSPAVSGDGSLVYDLITYQSSGSGLAATLGLTPLRVQGAETLLFAAAVAGDWLGAPPTNVQDAINRISSAVSGLLGGPIP